MKAALDDNRKNRIFYSLLVWKGLAHILGCTPNRFNNMSYQEYRASRNSNEGLFFTNTICWIQFGLYPQSFKYRSMSPYAMVDPCCPWYTIMERRSLTHKNHICTSRFLLWNTKQVIPVHHALILLLTEIHHKLHYPFCFYFYYCWAYGDSIGYIGRHTI